jgi:hypothetical protein
VPSPAIETLPLVAAFTTRLMSAPASIASLTALPNSLVRSAGDRASK